MSISIKNLSVRSFRLMLIALPGMIAGGFIWTGCGNDSEESKPTTEVSDSAMDESVDKEGNLYALDGKTVLPSVDTVVGESLKPQPSAPTQDEEKDKIKTEKDGTVILFTAQIAPSIKGYCGPIPLEIRIKQDKIVDIIALPNQETEEYWAEVEEELLPKWIGLSIKEALNKEVDAVSGATYSSDAVIRSVNESLRLYRSYRKKK